MSFRHHRRQLGGTVQRRECVRRTNSENHCTRYLSIAVAIAISCEEAKKPASIEWQEGEAGSSHFDK